MEEEGEASWESIHKYIIGVGSIGKINETAELLIGYLRIILSNMTSFVMKFMTINLTLGVGMRANHSKYKQSTFFSKETRIEL